MCPSVSLAVDNAATGGIGTTNNGTLTGGDGTGTARVTLNPVELELVKQARDQSGTVLPDNTHVVSGQDLYFVLYVDNPTPVTAEDVHILDALDESAFTYVPGSMQRAIVPSGSSNAAIWSAAWQNLTDAVGPPDDSGSVLDTGGPPAPDRITFGADPTQTNQTVIVPPSSMMAIRFRVRVN